MSQFFVTSVATTPSVPTSFVTDDGTATPAANTLNLLANDTQANNDNGIQTTGSGDTVTVELTNRVQTGVVSIGAGSSNVTLISFDAAPFSGTPGTYTFDCRVAAFETSTPAGAAYNIFGAVRTDGTTPTLLGTPDKFSNEEAALTTADATLAVSGNDLVLTVTGVAGLTINWDIVGIYTRSI